MEMQTKQRYTKRKNLCGDSRYRPRKPVDMEAVYDDIDSGMTLKEVASIHEVSENTLRRRHKKYQEAIEEMEEAERMKEAGRTKEEGYKLPPLPTGM